MSRFVLTAQIQLQAPTNARRVLGQIREQLGSARPVSIPVQVVGAQRAERAIQSITRETELASSAAEALGRNFGLAIKRFAAFTVASRAVSLFTNSLANAIDDAITFQREVIKISQVTGDSVSELRGLQDTITDLSTSLGTSSRDLLAVTRIFSQAGVRGRDLEVALSGIAKTTLAPTFENITDTAEGAVAILSQFQRGVNSLEGQLGSINAVAGQFAVESDDLIGAVRRFGGVFKASGGSLEELLAVFTSVRATTRESAESISTGLRTIFTRIQRPTTIKYLEDLGVKLTDVNGKFVGPFEAAQRLGKALEGLTEGDTKFIAIAEELGGFRQIGKVIPLLRQYKVSQDALITAQQGSTSLTKDAETAQQALAVQITKVREEFFALVRSIAESSSFQIFARTSLQLASGLIKVADALKPLLPLLATLAAFKFAQGVGGFLGGIGNTIRNIDTIAANSATRGPTRRNSGGKILGFNSGGLVPGSGNRDTVPAMLTPGEFVIKKSSVKKLGPEKLAAMNENRYATGSTGRGIEALDLDDSSFLGQVAERGKLKGKTLEEAYSLVGKNLPGTFTRVSKSIFSSAFGEGALEKAAKIISSGYNPKLETTKPATTRIGRISQQLESASSPKELTKRTEDKGKSFITNEGPLDIEPDRSVYGAVFLNQPTTGKKSFVGTVAASGIEKSFRATRQFKLYEAAARERLGKKDAKIPIPENIKKRIKNNKFIVKTGYLDKQVSENVKESILDGIINTVSNSSRVFDKEMSAKGSFNRDEAGVAKFLKSINVDNIVGNIFEGVLTSAGIPYASTKDESNAPIDFPKGVGGALAAKFNNTALANIPTDAKTRDTSDNIASFLKKIKNFEAARLANSPLASSIFNGLKLTKNPGGKNASLGGESSNKKIKPIKRASGGGVSGVSKSDTVPALLTPGEFVINKKSAERIGYGNLNRMNKQGVVGFNKGGFVGRIPVQKFNFGGKAAEQNTKVSFDRSNMMATGNDILKSLDDVKNVLSSFAKNLDPEMQKIISDIKLIDIKDDTKLGKDQYTGKDKTGKDILGIAGKSKDGKDLIGINFGKKQVGSKVVEHEGAHVVDRALGGGEELASRQEGTFQNKVAIELQKTLQKEGEQSAYRLDLAEIWADAMAKAPDEVKAILASTTDAVEGSKRLAEYFNKAGKPIEGLADLSADNFGSQQTYFAEDESKKKKSSNTDKSQSDKAETTTGGGGPETPGSREGKRNASSDKSGESTAGSRPQVESIPQTKEQQKINKEIARLEGKKTKNEEKIREIAGTDESAPLPSPEEQQEIIKLLEEQKKLIDEIDKQREKYKKSLEKEADLIDKINKKKKSSDTGNPKPDKTGPTAGGANPVGGKNKENANDKKSKKDLRKNEQERQIPGIDTPGAREKTLEKAYKATTKSVESLEAESESLYKSLDLATSRLKKLDDQIDELNKTKGGNKASKRAAEARIGLENERQRIEQEINKTEQKLTKKRSDQTDLKENLDRVRIERIKRATRENIQDPDTPTATRRRRRSRNASSANARSDSESAGQQSVGGNDPFGSLFVQLGVLSGVAAGVNTAISTLGNKSLEASDGMAALTIIGEKTASTLTVLGTTLITSLAGFKSLSKVLKETSGKSGFVNRSKNIGARAGQVGLGAFTAVAVVSAIGEAVSSGLSEFADRQAKIAQSKGDVAGAISASRASQQASSFGELFTIGGLAQSFFDPNFFKNRKKQADIAGAEAGIAAFGGASTLVDDDIRAGGNISQATSKLSQAAFEASNALNNLEPGSLKAIELRKQLNDQLKSGITNLVNNGASVDEATNAAIQFAAGNKRVEKELLAFAQSAIAAREAQKLLTRANIDSLKISSAFAAATSSVQAFVDGIKNPGETLSNNLQQLESNFSSVGVDAKPLIDSIQKQLESIVPADSPLKDAIKNQSNFARSISDFSLNVGNVLGNAEISSSNVAAAREDIQSLLRSAIPQDLPGPDRRKIQTIISDRVAKATESVSSVAEIDLSTITKDIANQARELSKGFFESAKLLANHNKLMLGLYQERQRLEQSAALAANEAIDIQLQAAKDFESFGGGKLTEGQRASANIAKFNNLSSSIGVNLAGRSADDFRNASSQISNIFAQSQQVRASRIAGFQGAVSPEQAASLDQSDKAIQSSKELIKTAQEEIAIRKAEIEIIRQKNKEEKDSLDRLISGDIEGFIQGQASSGAAAALRTGSSDLTSLFSASALGRGFKSLEDQGLSSEQLNRASSLTLNRFGINDDRSAGILSGNSEEIQRLNREGRDLSATIAEIAGETARFASSEIQIQDAVINAASVRFNETLNQVSAVNQGTQALSRGGTVYASRGIFVPRGTDTVPAMLTPGEFVVNRSAVRRGNNLQILRAMNSGGGASSQTHMKGGGQVSYYNMGGVVEGISSAFSNALPQLSNIFNDFSASVDKLVNSKFTVKLDPTNINVNFNGASFLQSMKEDIKNELLDHVASEISSYKLNSSGDLEKRPTIN